MKQRSIPTMVFLTGISLGFYLAYWLFDTRYEMIAKGAKIPSTFYLFVPPVLLLIAIVSMPISGQSLDSFGGMVLGIGLFITFILPVYIWWWYRYCEAAAYITDRGISLGTTFWIPVLSVVFLGLTGIGLLAPLVMSFVIQAGFNEMDPAQGRIRTGVPEPPYPKI